MRKMYDTVTKDSHIHKRYSYILLMTTSNYTLTSTFIFYRVYLMKELWNHLYLVVSWDSSWSTDSWETGVGLQRCCALRGWHSTHHFLTILVFWGQLQEHILGDPGSERVNDAMQVFNNKRSHSEEPKGCSTFFETLMSSLKICLEINGWE